MAEQDRVCSGYALAVPQGAVSPVQRFQPTISQTAAGGGIAFIGSMPDFRVVKTPATCVGLSLADKIAADSMKMLAFQFEGCTVELAVAATEWQQRRLACSEYPAN